MKRMHDKKQLSGGVTEEQFEELVRETPTDCRLVNDEGKLQLQLEHDGNVLGIDSDFGDTLFNSFMILSFVELRIIEALDEISQSGVTIELGGICLTNSKVTDYDYETLFTTNLSTTTQLPAILTINNSQVFKLAFIGFNSFTETFEISGNNFQYRISKTNFINSLETINIKQFNNPIYIEY